MGAKGGSRGARVGPDRGLTLRLVSSTVQNCVIFSISKCSICAPGKHKHLITSCWKDNAKPGSFNNSLGIGSQAPWHTHSSLEWQRGTPERLCCKLWSDGESDPGQESVCKRVPEALVCQSRLALSQSKRSQGTRLAEYLQPQRVLECGNLPQRLHKL